MTHDRGPRGEGEEKETHKGPPDSEHLSGLCPRCSNQSTFQLRGTPLPVTNDERIAYSPIDGSSASLVLQQVAVLGCDHCNQGIIVIEERIQGSSVGIRPTLAPVSYRGIQWWPGPATQMASTQPHERATDL